VNFLKLIRFPKALFRITTFLARNLWQARKIPVINKGAYDDVEFIPCTKDLVPYVSKLYAQFHEGIELGLDKKMLYSLAGEKLCLVVKDKKTNQIVGYSLTAKVGVIGLGYVGLPLAVEKAKAGFTVLGFDIQKHKVDKINRGENYIGDVVSEELSTLTQNGHLSATADFSRISECDVLAICVPTPLDKFKQKE